MSEIELIRRCYERIVAADFPYAAQDDEREAVKGVRVRGCHGNTQNVLFFTLTLEDGQLRDVRYDCQYCEPAMYITAEVLCELLEARPLGLLAELDDAAVIGALGGESRKILRQARTAVELLGEALAGA